MKKKFRPKPVDVPLDQTWFPSDAIATLAGFVGPTDRHAFHDLMIWRESEEDLDIALASAKAAFLAGDPEPLLRIGRVAEVMKRLTVDAEVDQWRLATVIAANRVFREVPVGKRETGDIIERARQIHRQLVPSAYVVRIVGGKEVATDVSDPPWSRYWEELGLGFLRRSKGGRPKKKSGGD